MTDYRAIIDRLITTAPSILTEWEAGFICSLWHKDDSYEYTEKQKEIISRINRKVLGGKY